MCIPMLALGVNFKWSTSLVLQLRLPSRCLGCASFRWMSGVAWAWRRELVSIFSIHQSTVYLNWILTWCLPKLALVSLPFVRAQVSRGLMCHTDLPQIFPTPIDSDRQHSQLNFDWIFCRSINRFNSPLLRDFIFYEIPYWCTHLIFSSHFIF